LSVPSTGVSNSLSSLVLMRPGSAVELYATGNPKFQISVFPLSLQCLYTAVLYLSLLNRKNEFL
jgi:hypothetical protein